MARFNFLPRLSLIPIDLHPQRFLESRQADCARTRYAGNLDLHIRGGWGWTFYHFNWQKDCESAGIYLDLFAHRVLENPPLRKDGLAEIKLAGFGFDLEFEARSWGSFRPGIIVKVVSSFKYDCYAWLRVSASRLQRTEENSFSYRASSTAAASRLGTSVACISGTFSARAKKPAMRM